MRAVVALASIMFAAPSVAQEVTRQGAAGAPISVSVAVPPGTRLVYVSGAVPDPVDTTAPLDSPTRFGDTYAQTRSVLEKLSGALKDQGMSLGDIVMMRVFLVAPPGQARIDFAGMMRAYTERFGTRDQPNKPARSTIGVASLAAPGFLVEIEATAARGPSKETGRAKKGNR
jgi:enamine deaminase RidA (YjgF/YER057c/UK114 family)